MVRIKHRYLLINILYPSPSPAAGRLAPGADKIPDVVKFHAPTSDLLDQRLLAKTIREGVGELFGEWGLGMIGGSLKGTSFIAFPSSSLRVQQLCTGKYCRSERLWLIFFCDALVIYLSPATSTAIVRVSRDHYRLVWAALTFITKLPKPIEQACCVRVVRCSGTIKKVEEEAVRRAREFIVRARLQGTGGGEIEKAMVGVRGGKTGRAERERDVGDVVSESESD